MFDFSTVAVTVSISSAIQYGFYLFLRRPLDRVDKLETKISDQIDGKISDLEHNQKAEGEKRRVIYARLEKIELTYRQNKECIRMHQDIVRLHDQSLASVIRLERVATGAEMLVKQIDAIAIKQISLGEDMAALSARIDRISPVDRISHPVGGRK